MISKRKILGERYEPGQCNENMSEHLHRYSLALSFSKSKAVLDIACGEGYGSNLMAGEAKSVSGVDIDEQTIALAKHKYKRSNLEYRVGRADKIPFENDSFDMVISFETLEHHDKHDEMLREIDRVLRPGGLCMISTPDKLVYSDRKNYKNPFHVKELYKEDFEKLIKKYFKHVVILKQQFLSGSLIIPDSVNTHKLSLYEGTSEKVFPNITLSAEYLIAVASNDNIPDLKSSMFLDTGFAQNKVMQFKNSSMRYKLGYFILNPIKYFRGKFD